MNACLYVGHKNTEWVWEMLPGKSPAEMPITGKSWARHAVDLCSLLKVSELFIADCFFYPELTRRLGDGSYWSMKLHYVPTADADGPEALLEQFERKPDPAEELLIFWGQVLPDIEDIDQLLDGLVPAETRPGETLPDGIYLLRGGVLHRCVCPLHRMDSVKNYFDLNMRILHRPGIYNLPGYSSEKGFCIGSNVITLFGCQLETPLIVQDNSCLGRSTILEGGVIIGSNVLIDDFSHLKRAVILNNTYVGRNMFIEDKIVAEHTVIDVKTGAHVELEDEFLVGNSGRQTFDRFAVAEFVIALFLLIVLLPGYLLGRLFRKWLAKLPFFSYVLKIYPKLPRVLTGHANLVRNGVRDEAYAFRFADQWLRAQDRNYRDFADVYFCTHRRVRTIVSVVVAALLKRMCTFTEPNYDLGGNGGAPTP